ncbi:MAG: glycosyltransferase family 9 protein [Ignavibacteria bacterium]|nr:MAG: glycosyltransferase family 9 protein [Ignavibacteria bacterium]
METLMQTGGNILVIQTAFLGDAILTLPMIQELKKKNSESKLDVLAIPSTEIIFSSSSYVDNVIVIDKREKHKSIKRLNNFIKELREKSYSIIYSPHRSFRSAYITIKLGVRETYGFDNSSFKYAYKNIVKYKQTDHEVQRNLELIGEDTKDKSWKISPEIIIAETEKEKVTDVLSTNKIDTEFIAVAPGSVWETKRYPKEYYSEVIKSLIAKNEKVVLIGGENDKLLCDEIAFNTNDKVKNLAGEFSVTETIQLLGSAKLLITNDSAPTHMGMCADIPVLTIYCSTAPGFGFYPYNNKSRYLSYDKLDCKPCGIHGYKECPVKSFDCGYKLIPEDILKEVEKMLGENE